MTIDVVKSLRRVSFAPPPLEAVTGLPVKVAPHSMLSGGEMGGRKVLPLKYAIPVAFLLVGALFTYMINLAFLGLPIWIVSLMAVALLMLMLATCLSITTLSRNGCAHSG